MSETILQVLARRAADMPHVRAFNVDGESMTFAELADTARHIAGRLVQEGVRPGDRCALLLPTSLDSIVLVYSTQIAGAIPVAIDPGLRPVLRRRRLTMLAPALIVTTAPLAEALSADEVHAGSRVATAEELRRGHAAPLPLHAPDPATIAYLQLTSGTMGDSRAAAVSFRALAAGLEGIRDRFDMSSSDVMSAWVPIHYAPGLVRYVFGTVQFGCRSHLIQPSALELSRWLSLLVETNATITSAPDFAYRLAARSASRQGFRLPHLRIATNGGERVRASTVEAFERAFGLSSIVQPSYGLAEATLIVTSARPGDPLLADSDGSVSCGQALKGLEVRTVDAHGVPTTIGQPGEIEVRGDALFNGYFGEPAQTASALRNGWLATGDLGVLDGNGNLYPRARLRALIKRAGAGLPPRDVEECLEVFGEVVGAAAFGVPHADRSTDDLVVIVEMHIDVQSTAARLAERVNQAIIDTIGMAPARVYLVPPDSIPRTASGKIARGDLAALVEDAGFLAKAYVGP